MPRAPKACGRFGCEARVVGKRYCDDHKPIGWATGSAPRTGTAEHRAWRKVVLTNARGLCQIRGPRCTYRATEADHIVPVAEGGAEFDPANGQGACSNCHDAKTLQEAARGRERARSRGRRTDG